MTQRSPKLSSSASTLNSFNQQFLSIRVEKNKVINENLESNSPPAHTKNQADPVMARYTKAEAYEKKTNIKLLYLGRGTPTAPLDRCIKEASDEWWQQQQSKAMDYGEVFGELKNREIIAGAMKKWYNNSVDIRAEHILFTAGGSMGIHNLLHHLAETYKPYGYKILTPEPYYTLYATQGEDFLYPIPLLEEEGSRLNAAAIRRAAENAASEGFGICAFLGCFPCNPTGTVPHIIKVNSNDPAGYSLQRNIKEWDAIVTELAKFPAIPREPDDNYADFALRMSQGQQQPDLVQPICAIDEAYTEMQRFDIAIQMLAAKQQMIAAKEKNTPYDPAQFVLPDIIEYGASEITTFLKEKEADEIKAIDNAAKEAYHAAQLAIEKEIGAAILTTEELTAFKEKMAWSIMKSVINVTGGKFTAEKYAFRPQESQNTISSYNCPENIMTLACRAAAKAAADTLDAAKDKVTDYLPEIQHASFVNAAARLPEAIQAKIMSRLVILRSGTKSLSLSAKRVAILIILDEILKNCLLNPNVKATGHAEIEGQYIYACAMEKLAHSKVMQDRLVSFYGPKQEHVFQRLQKMQREKNILLLPDDNYLPVSTFYVLVDLSEMLGWEIGKIYKDEPWFETWGTDILRDDNDIINFLIGKHNMVLAAGSDFGIQDKCMARITCCADIDVLDVAMDELEKAMDAVIAMKKLSNDHTVVHPEMDIKLEEDTKYTAENEAPSRNEDTVTSLLILYGQSIKQCPQAFLSDDPEVITDCFLMLTQLEEAVCSIRSSFSKKLTQKKSPLNEGSIYNNIHNSWQSKTDNVRALTPTTSPNTLYR